MSEVDDMIAEIEAMAGGTFKRRQSPEEAMMDSIEEMSSQLGFNISFKPDDKIPSMGEVKVLSAYTMAELDAVPDGTMVVASYTEYGKTPEFGVWRISKNSNGRSWHLDNGSSFALSLEPDSDLGPDDMVEDHDCEDGITRIFHFRPYDRKSNADQEEIKARQVIGQLAQVLADIDDDTDAVQLLQTIRNVVN